MVRRLGLSIVHCSLFFVGLLSQCLSVPCFQLCESTCLPDSIALRAWRPGYGTAPRLVDRALVDLLRWLLAIFSGLHCVISHRSFVSLFWRFSDFCCSPPRDGALFWQCNKQHMLASVVFDLRSQDLVFSRVVSCYPLAYRHRLFRSGFTCSLPFLSVRDWHVIFIRWRDLLP